MTGDKRKPAKPVGRKKSPQKPGRREKPPVPADMAKDLAELLDHELTGAKKDQIVELIGMQTYQGPYQHPEHLGVYEGYCPGFLDRSLAMAEKSQ